MQYKILVLYIYIQLSPSPYENHIKIIVSIENPMINKASNDIRSISQPARMACHSACTGVSGQTRQGKNLRSHQRALYKTTRQQGPHAKKEGTLLRPHQRHPCQRKRGWPATTVQEDTLLAEPQSPGKMPSGPTTTATRDRRAIMIIKGTDG